MKNEYFNIDFINDYWENWNCDYNYFLRYCSSDILKQYQVKTIDEGEMSGCPIIKLGENSYIIKNIIRQDKPKYMYQGKKSNQNEFALIYKKNKELPILICEGLSFFFYAAQKNNFNVYCSLGTHISTVCYETMFRYKTRILIADEDDAGFCYRNRCNRILNPLHNVYFLKNNSIENIENLYNLIYEANNGKMQ